MYRTHSKPHPLSRGGFLLPVWLWAPVNIIRRCYGDSERRSIIVEHRWFAPLIELWQVVLFAIEWGWLSGEPRATFPPIRWVREALASGNLYSTHHGIKCISRMRCSRSFIMRMRDEMRRTGNCVETFAERLLSDKVC